MDEQIRKLKELVDGSDNIVFFGGAGVSTESGIPDFRSVDGLYHQKFRYPPETMLSHSFYMAHKAEFYEFYRTQRGEFTPEGATPLTTTHPTLSSNVKFMNFYPFEDIETISPRPMLFITGENAHSREFSEDAYRLAAEPKELYIVPGAGHVDLYDRVSLIPFDKLESFFKEYLKK